MKIVLFLDLDDTLFQTAHKCPPGESIRPAAFRRDGAPLSFMTERQRTLLETLSRSAIVIPTTARNLDAFRRVDLPFSHSVILDFGGIVLLPDGTLDTAWDAVIRPRAQEVAAELNTVRQAVERFSAARQPGVYARVVSDFDMPLYVVVKHSGGDAAALEPIRAKVLGKADRERFFIHQNDNNLSLVPRFLGKERAVAHVLRHHFAGEPLLTLGLGDSLSDAAYLGLCDFALMPRASQLARRFLNAGDQ